jgi:hypothetical protein
MIVNPWQDSVTTDNVIPEKFSITLERTTNAFSNDYFVVFNTTDKQSGIDHYEVIEEPLNSKNLFGWGAATAPWVVAKSPYVLEDQSLNSTIRVKAIDKAGNEYIATYVVPEEQRTISSDNIYIYGGITALVFVTLSILIVVIVLWKKRRKLRKSMQEESVQTDNK